ncbi:MAG: hypothetical protein EOO07_34275 [Chitinophagaceae bacterium]|nr:MAG: hypothetical protein EOO07_34275 [Chitinophagaceae bacterium]
MKTHHTYFKFSLLFFMSLASVKGYSQEIDLKDYCIVAYANPTNTNFKTPFIYNFGDNNTFEHLDVDGKIRQGKYSLMNGNIKFDFGGGEENYQIKGDKVIPRGKTTSALLVKKINGNFVLYGTQLIVVNIYKNQLEGATYGVLDKS